MVHLWLLLALVGCGRINFDPRGDDGSMGDGSGSQATSDSGSAAGADSGIAMACQNATTVIANVTAANVDTCSTGQDQIDACGPAATQEVVFKFTPAATAVHTVRTYLAGSTNVISTMHLGTTCQVGTCPGISQMQLTGGTTYYYAVEATGGGCTSIDFSITQP